MTKKSNTKEFKEKVKNITNNEYSLIGEYINSRTKVEILHKKCGSIYFVRPSSFMQGSRCPYCYSAKLKKTTKQFKQEVFDQVGNEYEILDKYNGNKAKIRIKHINCGHIFKTVPNNFLVGHRCPKCSGLMKKTTEQFKKEVLDLVNDEYTVLGEYINSKTKIIMRHNKCGYKYKVAPNSFLRGHRCPKCFGTSLKTNEQFKQEVFDLVGDEYTVLGEYINSKTKIKILHNICRYEYQVRPNDFIKGVRCPKCAGSMKKTTEQFKNEVFNLVGDEYIILGEYVNNNTKIKILHKKCGFIFETSPDTILQGHGCPKCGGTMKKTTEKFKKEVFNLVGNEYGVIGEYINGRIKIKMRHNICRTEYEVVPGSFLMGRRCPKCYGTPLKTTKEFKQEVFNQVGNEYTVLGEYKNVKTKIKMQHNKCGFKYEVLPANFLSGVRCPKCGGSMKKTTEQFKNEVYEKVGDEYTVLGKYINANTKIKMQHNKCGYEYRTKPADFLSGYRCPRCNQAKGEEIIHNFLDMMGFKIKMQFKQKECKNIRPLPFDFALFENDTLKTLIEYDGIQHFQPVSQFGGKEGFKVLKRNDEIKDKYCKDNRIPFIRISYKDFENIENILEKKLKLNHKDVLKRKKEFKSLKHTSTNTEDFIKKVKNLTGNEYSVLGEYIYSNIKIRIKHNKCGYEYEVRPNNFLSGARCPKCAGSMKKNTKIFKQEVFDLVNNEYTVLGEYINSKTKIKMRHNKCGYEYKVAPAIFIFGIRCPNCARSIKKTTAQFKQEVQELVGNEYEVLGEYKGAQSKIRMLHNKCGYEYKVTPHSFISGTRCPKCGGKMKKTDEQFKQEIYDLVGDEYTVLGEYVNTSTKIKIIHNKCGFIFEIKPNSFLSGNRCLKCSGKMKKTTEQFKQEIFDLLGDEYTVLGEYINSKTKIEILHKKCGYKYSVKPNVFLSGSRCPKCAGSMKKNTEIFKQEVFDLVNDEYTVLGEYINSKTKIIMRHNKCGYKYKVAPNNFLRGNRCPNCSR